MANVLFIFPLPPWRQFIAEIFDDGIIEKYGRDDLFDVFLATKLVTLVKACEWDVVIVANNADCCCTIRSGLD